MKRIAFIFSLSLILGFFCGCDEFYIYNKGSNDTDPDTGTGNPIYPSVTPSETLNITCTSTPAIYEIEPDVKTINVTGTVGNISAKDIYFATTNPTSSEFDGTYSRTVVATSNNIDKHVVTSREANPDEESFSIANACGSHKIDDYFNSTPVFSGDFDRTARATGTPIDRSSSQLDLTPNSTKKMLYVDYINLSTFIEKQATLRAVGEYCNVWVIDENWTSGTPSKGGSKVNVAIARKVADFFDDVYSLETYLYGKESDYIFFTDRVISSTSDFDIEPMKMLSDTGTKVNLVILSISEENVLGYFSRKDYFPNLTDINTLTAGNYKRETYSYYGSNEGKYLYINAASCVEDVANVMTIVTHEYQHLINFGRKTMAHHVKGASLKLGTSDLNEMMAMVCEDFIKEYTKEHYKSDGFTDENTPFIYRLPTFNVYFSNSGIEYRAGYSQYSYPTLYTFGAWCARKYGGVHLMYDIVNSTDTEHFTAIKNSIKKTSGLTVTTESLLKEFVYDCIVPNSASGTNAFMKAVTLPNTDQFFNKDKNYGYPLTSINLWNLTQYCASVDTIEKLSKGLNGPVYGGYSQYLTTVRPYGFCMNKVGTTQLTNSFTLSLASKSGYVASALKTYLIIQ